LRTFGPSVLKSRISVAPDFLKWMLYNFDRGTSEVQKYNIIDLAPATDALNSAPPLSQ
jgi:hypothetical protein